MAIAQSHPPFPPRARRHRRVRDLGPERHGRPAREPRRRRDRGGRGDRVWAVVVAPKARNGLEPVAEGRHRHRDPARRGGRAGRRRAARRRRRRSGPSSSRTRPCWPRSARAPATPSDLRPAGSTSLTDTPGARHATRTRPAPARRRPRQQLPRRRTAARSRSSMPGCPASTATSSASSRRWAGRRRTFAAIVLTHGDTDHVGFADRLRREPGIPVYVHAADAARARGEVKKPSSGWGPMKPGPFLGFMAYGLRKGGLRTKPVVELVDARRRGDPRPARARRT